jgi:hypothetical protein
MKNFNAKDDRDPDNQASKALPLVVLLFFLFGKKDENIAKVAKKIILENGAIQGKIFKYMEASNNLSFSSVHRKFGRGEGFTSYPIPIVTDYAVMVISTFSRRKMTIKLINLKFIKWPE